MKSFAQTLTETKKTYEFKIGVAGDLPEGFEDRLETGLQKYSLNKISSKKKTPIQERPLDFPNLQNMEVTYWDIDVSYPTTSQVLQEYLSHVCSVSAANIIVRREGDPRSEDQSKADNEPYEPLITNPELAGESAQSSVAGNRVMELLKELESVRKEKDNDPMAAAPNGSNSATEK